ncbi:hypothetical protein PIB30_041971 [Stylosanthes scabra]|uniref:RRM domain-containing protein n=1 Tax=Stylosanthes scabra TaxID=79078 RepID=A0ABU6WF33_9FABA|nr:hypothetical protein [Stylosanthes scabra]
MRFGRSAYWSSSGQTFSKGVRVRAPILVYVINNRETGRSIGFRFVTFASEQSMRDAIDGNKAQSRRDNGGGDGGFKSGGGSRYGFGGYVGVS